MSIVVVVGCGAVEPVGSTSATLTVTVTGTGEVTSTPPGITCPGTCSAEFEPGVEVKLDPVARTATSFSGWSESCAPGRRACTLTLAAGDTAVGASFATQGARRWLETAGGQGVTFGNTIAVGPIVVIAGQLQGPATIGGMDVDRAGRFVAALDPETGRALWVKVLNADVFVAGATVDASGNVAIAGNFVTTIDLGSGPIQSAGATDGFVARYGPDGAYQWARSFGGVGENYAWGIALDPAGDVYVAGDFAGAVDFGRGPKTAAGTERDVYVARYRGATGDPVWMTQIGGAADDALGGIVIDHDGEVGVAAGFRGTLVLAGEQLTANDFDGLITKLNGQTGEARFAKRIGGASFDFARGIRSDSLGNLYVVGTYTSPADVGGAPLLAGGQMFIAKYTTAGAHDWSHGIVSTALTLAVDSFDDVVIAGDFRGRIDLGNGSVFTATEADAYVAKLDRGGLAAWAKRLGGTQNDFVRGVAIDALDRIYMTGAFEGFADFDGETPSAKGDQDMFTISFGP